MKIKELREAAGFTQSELAEKVGAKRSAVSMWETKKSSPHPSVIPKLATALNCSINDLFCLRRMGFEGER